MASTPELRNGSWTVYWRQGGRGGKKQRTTWDNQQDAIQAKKLAEAHGHRITRDEIYDLVLGTDPENDPKATPTLREWSKVWLETKTRITPGTASTYRRQFDAEILPALGDKQLHQIDGTDVARFINKLRSCDCADGKRGPRCSRRRGDDGHGLTDATATRYYSALHACLEYAVKEKKIDDNPAKRTDFIRDVVAHDDTGDEEGHVYLTPHEYGLILAAAKPDAQPFIEFLAGTGARFSEASAMAVNATKVDDEPPTVSIHRAWKSGRQEGSATRWYLGATKGRTRRTIEIDDDLAELLKPLTKDQPAKGFLFRAPDGKGHIVYRNWFERRWLPAILAAMRCELHPPAPRGRAIGPGELAGRLCGDNGGTRDDGGRCGAKTLDGWDRCRTHVGPAADAVSDCDCPTRLRKRATPHDLRHTHAAWLFSDGVPPLEISRRLGHKQLSTTSEIYGGLMPETQRASVAAIKAARRKAKPPAAAGELPPSEPDDPPAGGPRPGLRSPRA